LLYFTELRIVKAAAESMAENLTELLAKRGIAARVLEAQPSAIARIRNRYRYDVILIFETAAGLMSAMDLFKAEGSLRARVKNVTVDVDPVSLQ
ncbi:MAG: hypothetical protein ACE5E1_11050, partial [Phycisphaerae bacterium]